MKILIIVIFTLIRVCRCSQWDTIYAHGPGLQPERIVMPARYFFINCSLANNTYTSQLDKDVVVEINGTSTNHNNNCRVWANKLDRKDGTFIVRYKVYNKCENLSINIFYKGKHIKGSPFTYKGPIYPDQCDCPQRDFDTWLQEYGCPKIFEQIERDLDIYQNVDMKSVIKKILERYHKPESTSFCHYVVKDNNIHRNCYGRHIGFNMFSDNILLFLARKVVIPDMELVINLGDWPLVHKNTEPLPIFSWCGSDDTFDIVMPTYDITESTLENMGRVTLDILSVQGSVAHAWKDREERAVWRGRDSRLERLKLVDIARANPELFNVSLTNFFFFRDKEAQYGPKAPYISFFKFFDYKYQINIDGTVAAYRLPYLLAGGGMVLKQESPYYEHFYKQLNAWEHYVPVSRDLSDLKESILWARENDDKAHKIARNARNFANNYLLPQHIICYHAVLFSKWKRKINSTVTVTEDMTFVPQPEFPCDCNTKKYHEEL